MQHVPAADRVTCDQADDGLGHAPDITLEFQDVETGHAVFPDVAPITPYTLVPARAERVAAVLRRPLPGKEHDPDARVFSSVPERLLELQQRPGRKAFRTRGRLMAIRATPSAFL